MGVKGGCSFYYKVVNLNANELITVFRKISNSAVPVIYVDCNWVANYLGRTDGSYVRKTVDLLYVLAACGFMVAPVVDGYCQHESKVATATRKLERELDRIDVMKLCAQALSLTSQLKESFPIDNKNKIIAEEINWKRNWLLLKEKFQIYFLIISLSYS